MSDSRFPPSSSDSSKPILIASDLKGDTGSSPVYVYPAVPVIPIPCDNDGSNPVYSAATSDILVYLGSVLQTGWTLAYVTGSNCTGSVNNAVEPRTATIAAVTDIAGYAEFTAAKLGTTLIFRVYFSKVPEGATGASGVTGPTGSTGATGSVGATGSDGTGVVVIKKTITIDAGVVVASKEDYGDGTLQMNFASAHGYTLGDFVYIYGATIYDNEVIITEIVDSDSIKVDIAYSGLGGTLTCYDQKLLRSVASIAAQNVGFNDIIPVGAKILEWQLMMTDLDNLPNYYPLTVSIGTSRYSSSGYNSWLSGAYMQDLGQIISRDRRSTVSMSKLVADSWLRFTPGINFSDSQYDGMEFQFLIAYINYAPDYP